MREREPGERARRERELGGREREGEAKIEKERDLKFTLGIVE